MVEEGQSFTVSRGKEEGEEEEGGIKEGREEEGGVYGKKREEASG